MYLNRTVILNSPKSVDGKYKVSGWINCPKDSRVLLRFLTGGTSKDQVEGLHWGATGGWYKYLPASGKKEYFEVTASLDDAIHGAPEIRIERWYGDGEIEVVLESYGWQPLTLYWGNDESFKSFLQSSLGLVEKFELNSSLVTAAEPKNGNLVHRLKTSSTVTKFSPDLIANVEKNAFQRLELKGYDALVVDLKSLCVPIINVEGVYIELTREARAFGAVPLNNAPIEPGTPEYLAILRKSLVKILQFVRPRPVFIFDSERTVSTNSETAELRTRALDSMLDSLELEDMGFIHFFDAEPCEEKTSEIQRKILDELIEPHLYSFDKHMVISEPANKFRLLTQPSQLRHLSTKPVEGLPQKFSVEVDVLVSHKYRENNLVLTLELENFDGSQVTEKLGGYSISKSKNPEIGYFKYFPPVKSSETVQFEIELPEGIKCVGIGVNQVRDQGPVFISRLEVKSNEKLNLEIPPKNEQGLKGRN